MTKADRSNPIGEEQMEHNSGGLTLVVGLGCRPWSLPAKKGRRVQ